MKHKIFGIMAAIREKQAIFLEKQLKNAGINDLHHTHGSILAMLYRNPDGLMVTELADMLGRTKSTVSELLTKLEKNGYVLKTKSKTDNRAMKVNLTDKSLALSPIFKDISQKMFETAYSGIEDEEQELLGKTLYKVLQNFGN